MVSTDMGSDKFGGRANAYNCIYGHTNRTTSALAAKDQTLTCSPPTSEMLRGLPGKCHIQILCQLEAFAEMSS